MWTQVSGAARLHFGLFNLSGLNQKMDGGAGIALTGPICTVTIRDDVPGQHYSRPVSNAMAVAVAATLNEFTLSFDLPTIGLIIDQAIPEHVGLGSKTACLMTLGRALSQHFSLGIDYIEVARLVKRGGTSGVGVHASQLGGIVIDNGHAYPGEKTSFLPSSASTAPPPSLAEHHPAPENCFVIHFRLESQGLSGIREKHFFQQHCPIPEHETIRLLGMVDSVLLPGIRKRSVPDINDGLQALQNLGLKAHEWTIQGPITKATRETWEKVRAQPGTQSLPPMCLSSLGPTVFMLSDNPELVVAQLTQIGVDINNISYSSPAPLRAESTSSQSASKPN